MTQKIVISKAGYNAVNETDPDHLVYSSDYDSLKYYVAGSVDLDMSGAGDVEANITHNLGYVPFFIAYLNYVPLVTDYAAVPSYSASFGNWQTLDVYATTTKLYFTVKKSGSPAFTWTIVYKIFRNNMGL